MKTILSIGSHPDDIEIGCGGTEALLIERGYRVIHLVMTSGEQGSIHYDQKELGLKREQEAIDAAKTLGVEEVIFFKLPDGLTSFSIEDKIKLIKLIRQIKPEIIFTHAKDDSFPDHQIIRSLCESAVTASSGPWYLSAGEVIHKVSRMYGYEVWHPISSYQVAFNITEVIDKKHKALSCHLSQVESVSYMNAIEGLGLYRGAMSMKGKYAEVFEIVFSDELL